MGNSKQYIFTYNLKISIIQSRQCKYIYIYNINYFCVLTIPHKIKLNIKLPNYIQIKQDSIVYNISNNLTLIKKFLKQFVLCTSIKIKFTGKGYKIKKNTKNNILLLFNRAHLTGVWWKNIYVKKLKKYKLYVKYTNQNYKVVTDIVNTRPLNIFTKRGLRLSRQIVLKKKGK